MIKKHNLTIITVMLILIVGCHKQTNNISTAESVKVIDGDSLVFKV